MILRSGFALASLWLCCCSLEPLSGTRGDASESPLSDGGSKALGGFGYPVGDKSTAPAGGFLVWQVLGHYWDAYGGRHLAQDLAASGGGEATVDAPVYSIADGLVRYAGPNSSTYRNVVLIEHTLASGEKVCSFFGHINTPLVSTGDTVARGQQITTVMDWAQAGGGASSNTHLHYVVLNQALCDASAAANGSLICGYDTGGASSVVDIASEPARYQSLGDICGGENYGEAFLSPSQLIEANHF